MDEFRNFVRTHGLKPEELRSRATRSLGPKAQQSRREAEKESKQLRELDLRTQITMNRRTQVMEALMSHATTSNEREIKRSQELQKTLRTLDKHMEWAEHVTAPLTADHPADEIARKRELAERRFPRQLERELNRRSEAMRITHWTPDPGAAKRTIRAVIGPSKTSKRPATTGAIFGRYNTSADAVNVGGKLEKQDKKRLDSVSNVFWGKRAVREGGTVAIPLYKPGSPYPELRHVSTLGLTENPGSAVTRKRTMRQVLGGSRGVLAARG